MTVNAWGTISAAATDSCPHGNAFKNPLRNRWELLKPSIRLTGCSSKDTEAGTMLMQNISGETQGESKRESKGAWTGKLRSRTGKRWVSLSYTACQLQAKDW